MKHKRLDRDAWWEFDKYRDPEYYQMRLDTESFHGMVSVLRLVEGRYTYWTFPRSGKVKVTGEGIVWLQLLPDDTQRFITAMYVPQKKMIDGIEYPYSVSVWYVDITEGYYYDDDGVLVYIDKYLDVIFTPEGDVKIDDRDELEAALATGDVTQEQYERGLEECDRVVAEMCADVNKTEAFCSEILKTVFERIDKGEGRMQRHSAKRNKTH